MIVPGICGFTYIEQGRIGSLPGTVEIVSNCQPNPFGVRFSIGIAHIKQAILSIHFFDMRIMASGAIPIPLSSRRKNCGYKFEFILR